MRAFLGQAPLAVLIGVLIVGLIAFGFWLSKRLLYKRTTKSIDSKALLKSLLEDLSLEVPLELQDLNKNVLKSLKKS